MLASDPKNLSGSLGIAISEAVEVAVKDPGTRYALGSVCAKKWRAKSIRGFWQQNLLLVLRLLVVLMLTTLAILQA